MGSNNKWKEAIVAKAKEESAQSIVLRFICLLASILFVMLTFVWSDKVDIYYGLGTAAAFLISAMAPNAFKKLVLVIPQVLTKVLTKFLGKNIE